MEIGERVRMLRKGKGMTQGDLANATRIVNQVYISRLETGRLKNVKPHIAKALSEALGVSLEYLILGDEPLIRPSDPGNQPVQVLTKVPDVSADHLFPEEEPSKPSGNSAQDSCSNAKKWLRAGESETTCTEATSGEHTWTNGASSRNTGSHTPGEGLPLTDFGTSFWN